MQLTGSTRVDIEYIATGEGSDCQITTFAAMMKRFVGPVRLALTGMAIGIAEVIPGVSGGTIAFITGIYERLLNAIRSVDSTFVGHLARLRLLKAWRHIDGPAFLLFLVLGMAAGIVIGVFGVSHLMEKHPEELWGFFFGLIVASAMYIGRQVDRWKFGNAALMVAGLIGAYIVTTLTPAEGSAALPYVFLSGVIAISALILPGISGSFMLLLMGMYTVVIPAVKGVLSDFSMSQFVLVAVFALGCMTGLLSVARVLSWLFDHQKERTLAVLTGIMLGSLNKIWPWRMPVQWLDEAGNVVSGDNVPAGEFRVLTEINVLPGSYTLADPNTAIVAVCGIGGFLLVFVIDRLTHKGTGKP